MPVKTIGILLSLIVLSAVIAAETREKTNEITVAAISIASLDGALDSNYDRAYRLCKIALNAKPDIILLPESFAAGYCTTNFLDYAETRQSPHLKRFRDLSRAHKCMIVLGYLEKFPRGVKNAIVVFDSGSVVGRHYKSKLWPDKKRPYRDEVSLLLPGDGVEVFDTRLGKFSILICYENIFQQCWAEVAGRVDFILSPYNCERDACKHNIKNSKQFNVPSIWCNRTGTVFAGEKKYIPNMGTSGIVDAQGKVLAKSEPGVEKIVIGKILPTKKEKQALRPAQDKPETGEVTN
jgi:predicted amidohydrolase